MAKPVLMPKLSSTMTHGSVTEWYVEEGDYVEVGQPIFEVMTDKIAIEVESYEEGYILKKYLDVNEEVPCNSTIAYIGEKGEEVPETMSFEEEAETDNLETSNESLSESSTSDNTKQISGINEKDDLRATPYARKLAKEKGLDLSLIAGSGRFGRIQAQDVMDYKEQPAQSGVDKTTNAFELIEWKGMRKAVADSMVHSSTTIPHVTMNATVSAQSLLDMRKEINQLMDEDEKVTITDMFSFATVKALKKHKYLNARTSEEGIEIHDNVNLGIAVALGDDELVVPVIKEANYKSLSEISSETRNLSTKARSNELSPDSFKGGTFTITSLGRTVVKNFNPIINHPEVAILGVGGMYKVDELPYIDISLSFDHRALDGYPASQFMNTLVSMLENPTLLII